MTIIKNKLLLSVVGIMSMVAIIYFGDWQVWLAVLVLNWSHFEITDGYTKNRKE